MTTAQAPQIINQYLHAASIQDSQACAACFTPEGTVLDEGKTYKGREEIRAWRESVRSQWSYTTTITGSEAINDTEYRVTADVDGNFPGGHASLTFSFSLQDGLIADLRIL
jgi:hypothetical protein